MTGESSEEREDIEALLTIALDTVSRVEDHATRLKEYAADMSGEVYDTHAAETSLLLEQARSLCKRLEEALAEGSRSTLKAVKKTETELLRLILSRVGACRTAVNWHSPTFVHALEPLSGVEKGKVHPSNNDYKRDMHTPEQEYAKAFVAAYIEHTALQPVQALPTSSGMAAITTVLTALKASMPEDGVVLASVSSYFQSKWVLKELFGENVLWVNEFDTNGIVEAVKKHSPHIVFLDALGGTVDLPMLNLPVLLPALARLMGNGQSLVLDTTALGSSFQPLAYLPHALFGMRLIVVESLVKYHQFGLDRVSGGIIWQPTALDSSLFEARMHLGTIMNDVSVESLPWPNRKVMDHRLQRSGRNARVLAERIAAHAAAHSSPVAEVVHPSLPEYPGAEWSAQADFHGSFVTLRCKGIFQTPLYYDRFVAKAIEEARKRSVELIGGTSFGFDATRVYVTARFAKDHTPPFLRIAAGTETKEDIEKVAESLCAAMTYAFFS